MSSDNYIHSIYSRQELASKQQDYTDQYEDFFGDTTSFEEQLLLNYDDYLDDNFEIQEEYHEDEIENQYDEQDGE